MARRRTAALALTILALALGGCAAHKDGAVAAWRTPAGASGQGGGGAAGGSSPSTKPRPSTSPTKPGAKGGQDPPDSPGSTPSPTRSRGPAGKRNPMGLIYTASAGNVALTFDDGPGPYTGQILDLLDRYHVKATFCMIGRQVQAYADVVRRIVADGMTLCNHTWDHDEKLRTRTPDAIRAELVRTNDAIHAVAPGAKIEYFRNPGGLFGPDTVAIAKSLGMKPLMWNVDPQDWDYPGTEAIVNNVLRHTHHGSVVLSHDGGGVRTQTVAAYRTIIPNLRSRFHLVPMPVV
jgi:peptidoglycan/xylan/chitin deacetylase (PgdA/CDA1 family)